MSNGSINGFGDINAVLRKDPFNSGKLNIISILSVAVFSIETLLARIFVQFKTVFFEIMFSLWMFTITGIVLHELLGRSAVKWEYTFFVPRQRLLMLGAIAFFAGVFAQVSAYTLTVGWGLERVPFMASTFGFEMYAINLGAAIAEEWAFAWGFLGLWLMLLKGVGSNGRYRMVLALLANASIFTIYHFAVADILHQGELNFLPAMFGFRIALDVAFILSDYDLSVPLIGHFLTNLFKTVAGNSLATQLAEGAVVVG